MLTQMNAQPDDWFNGRPATAATMKASQCLAFFALTRIGEITSSRALFDAARNMTRGDVKIHCDNQGREFLTVVIKNSKRQCGGSNK